jgi:hypothetical protein
LRIDSHLDRTPAMAPVVSEIDRVVIGLDIPPSGTRAACRRRG